MAVGIVVQVHLEWNNKDSVCLLPPSGLCLVLIALCPVDR